MALNKSLRNIRNLVFKKKTTRVSFEPMWFLGCETAEIKAKGLPPKVEKALLDIRENGVAVLPANISHEDCDAVVRDFNNYIANSNEAQEYRDDYGLHERLCNLQLISDAAKRICFNKSTAEILQAAFASEFTVVGSLFFEKGSTQSIHRDTPAFFTNPLNHYFGVWNAMEDIAVGSGPLMYYAGGHKLVPDESLYLDEKVTINNYFNIVEDACKQAGLELVEFYPKKGDTLIWHPQLPHGGGKIANAGSSRRSLVFHCIPKNTPIYGTDEFFDPSHLVPVAGKSKTISHGINGMLDQGTPRFFHNRYEGNFDEV